MRVREPIAWRICDGLIPRSRVSPIRGMMLSVLPSALASSGMVVDSSRISCCAAWCSGAGLGCSVGAGVVPGGVRVPNWSW